jgi:O-antigen ligase
MLVSEISNSALGAESTTGSRISGLPEGPTPVQGRTTELRWSFGFVAMLGYLFVEYMRLSAQYPVFQAVNIGKVIVGIGFLGWLVAPAIPGKRPAVRFVDGAMVAFVLAAFVSACFARYQREAWEEILNILRWAVIYFLISRIVVSSWRQRMFVFVLLLLNLKMAQFSIRNFHAFQEAGMSATALAKFGVGAGGVGFFANAGDFGVAMCVVWPLAGILLLGEKKLIPRLILLASFLGISGAIVVCGSRGALVGALVAAMVAWVRNPRRIGAAILFLVFIPGVFFVLPEASKERLRSALHPEADGTADRRLRLWKAGLKMFEDRPLLGVGPSNFPLSFSEKYATPDDPDIRSWVPHNIFIQALSELGMAGTIPVLLLIVGCFRLNARTRKYLLEQGSGKPKGFNYYLATGFDMGLVGYMVSGMFLTVLYYPHLWVLLGMSAGLHVAVTSKPVGEEGLESGTAPGRITLAGSFHGRP